MRSCPTLDPLIRQREDQAVASTTVNRDPMAPAVYPLGVLSKRGDAIRPARVSRRIH
jgi:hypothetical protein